MKNIISSNIKETTNELIKIISSINEEQLNEVPFEGNWSVGQVGDHLLKSYGAVDILNGSTKKSERLPGEKIEMIKEAFLNFSVKYESQISILPTNNFIEKEKLLSGLENRIVQIKKVIETQDLSEICTGIALPVFDEFTRLEWLHLILYHTQRHIHQIKTILKSFESQIVLKKNFTIKNKNNESSKPLSKLQRQHGRSLQFLQISFWR